MRFFKRKKVTILILVNKYMVNPKYLRVLPDHYRVIFVDGPILKDSKEYTCVIEEVNES